MQMIFTHSIWRDILDVLSCRHQRAVAEGATFVQPGSESPRFLESESQQQQDQQQSSPFQSVPWKKRMSQDLDDLDLSQHGIVAVDGLQVQGIGCTQEIPQQNLQAAEMGCRLRNPPRALNGIVIHRGLSIVHLPFFITGGYIKMAAC